MIRGASASTAAPIGTLTKKTQRQLRTSTITPPRSSPMAPPAPAMAPQTASARFRSGPSAKVVRMSESAAGETMAPPSPCRPRATSSVPSDWEIPQMNEAAAKRAIPVTNSRRRPRRGDPTEDRGGREEAAPGHERRAPPEPVGEAPAEQEEAAEDQRVGV